MIINLSDALHIARNPWGHHPDQVREAILYLADKCEEFSRRLRIRTPPDGTRDGDGTWRGGKWHPDDPEAHSLSHELILRSLEFEKLFEWRGDGTVWAKFPDGRFVQVQPIPSGETTLSKLLAVERAAREYTNNQTSVNFQALLRALELSK
jgi:hypothetical protein